VNVPGQKDTVKAYSHYWTGLSYWREARERLSMRGEIRQDKVAFKFSEKDVDDISADIRQGLEHLDRALEIKRDYAEAHNVKNLLHAEAALLASASDEARAETERRAALESLRQALKHHKPAAAGAKESADFGAPTVRVAEFARTKDEHAKLVDPMMKHVEGGQPIMQAAAALPGLRAPKPSDNPSDPAASGVTSDGGAYSVGAGRGALNAAYAGGKVKVEVLVSTAGNVVFARVVDGRGDLNGPALAAAKKWKFTPAKFEGHPVQLNGVITFNLRPGAARPSASPTPAPKKT
jgi:TonB family protein